MALNSLFRGVRFVYFFPLALAFSLPTPASCAEEIKCPDISTRQNLEHPVAGWTERLNDSAHALDNVMFFDGDPKDKVSLAPSQDATAKGKYSATWLFGSNQETQVWVALIRVEVDLARS